MAEPDEPRHPARHEEQQDGDLPQERDSEGGEAAVPDEDDALDAVEERGAPPLPKRMREIMALVGQWGPAPNPVAEKLTGEHISVLLDLERVRLNNLSESEKGERSLHLVVFCGFCLFVLILVWMLLWAGNDELTEKILIGLVSAVASGLGGYGLGKSRRGA